MLDIGELNDLPTPSAKEVKAGETSVVLVRSENQIFAYRNRCPHRGIRLDWEPDQFLDLEKQYIQCASHGALFTLETGLCISGPCNGQSLEPIACQVKEGRILIDLTPE